MESLQDGYDPFEDLSRDVALIVLSAERYRQTKGRWPSVKALGKVISNLALSRRLGKDVFGYRTGFIWVAHPFGGYLSYDSFFAAADSFLDFLSFANLVASQFGVELKVVSNPRGRGRIVKVERTAS